MKIKKDLLTAKTLTLLEYSTVMEKAASFALSDEAAALIKNEKPVFDFCRAEETKTKVLYIMARINNSDSVPGSWLPSIGFLMPKLGVEGAVLEIDEAYAIGLFVQRGTELKDWLLNKEDSGALSESSPDCKTIAADIFRVLDKEGKMRDLPPLRAIKRRIKSLNRELEVSISHYISDDETRKMLQSAVPSQRDGRTVLAVKVNFRGRIKGIVHEVSSSGQTVFVEPLDVVEKNNELLVEKRNLDAEIIKIMRELTICVAAQRAELENFHRWVIESECLRAKAKYSINTKGQFTAQNSSEHDDSLLLKQARHPMLKNAVPIDLAMKGNTRTLIITGPNTGGKTVALKTLGLFALMNQSGLALPVDEGSILPFFDGIYADIGDEQSIKQSLSTFSAHISNIAAIVSNATEKSLVLLDELGSGTDPAEGGAIAMAVLDYLIEKKSRMVVTTHHGILKNYGYTRHGVENASVEFNAQTLSPTYKVINGVPGESRALDIAGRNGLGTKIVEKARSYLDEEKSDVSALIKGLREKHLELHGLENKNKSEEIKLRETRRKADLKELSLKQKEAELKRDAAGKLRLLLNESRKTLENLVREIKEDGVDREKTRRVKDFLNELAHNVEEENNVLEKEELAIREQLRSTESPAASAGFAPGMEVFIGLSKQRGTILRPDKKNAGGNSWIVETGSLKISFPEKDLSPAGGAGAEKTAGGWAAELGSSAGAVFELKLLGMRLEDAMEALRRQIEAAALSGLKAFSVIHGKGDGILQKGVHDYLKNDPSVEEYYFSRPELGGFGRTEVILR